MLLFPVLPRAETTNPYEKVAAEYGVPAWLLFSIAYVESGLDPYAVNCNGRSFTGLSFPHAVQIIRSCRGKADVGLMQVNCALWGPRLGLTCEQLLVPEVNLRAGAYVLSTLLRRKNFWDAVGSYHSGRKKRKIRYAWKVYRAARKFFRGGGKNEADRR